MTDEVTALRGELPLGDDANAFLDNLPVAQRETLARQVREAAATEHRQLNRAIEDAAAFVPGPLRRRARKLLLG